MVGLSVRNELFSPSSSLLPLPYLFLPYHSPSLTLRFHTTRWTSDHSKLGGHASLHLSLTKKTPRRGSSLASLADCAPSKRSTQLHEHYGVDRKTSTSSIASSFISLESLARGREKSENTCHFWFWSRMTRLEPNNCFPSSVLGPNGSFSKDTTDRTRND